MSMVGPTICRSSLWNLFHVTVPEPRTLRWLLDAWKIYAILSEHQWNFKAFHLTLYVLLTSLQPQKTNYFRYSLNSCLGRPHKLPGIRGKEDESASETNRNPVAESKRVSRRDTHSVTKVMLGYETAVLSIINVGNDQTHATVASVSPEVLSVSQCVAILNVINIKISTPNRKSKHGRSFLFQFYCYTKLFLMHK